ncbi:MAG: AAA family ATPase [Elusimicrobiota bacterium]
MIPALSISKGMRQRVAIASILAMQPDTIIVDEPTTGQDHKQSIAVMEFLKNLNRKKNNTIIIITHDMYIVAGYAKRTLLFKDGENLLDGDTRELFKKEDILKKARVKPPAVNEFSKQALNKNILTLGELLSF